VSVQAQIENALGELRRQAGDAAALRAFVEKFGRDWFLLAGVLRRDVPEALLEYVAQTRPWCEDRRLAGVLVGNPRTPSALALRLVSELYWRDLADVATSLHLPAALRVRAEALLVERLGEMRRGDKIALARRASPGTLRALLHERDSEVLDAVLFNPRLQEQALLAGLRAEAACPQLLEAAARSPRWSASYAVAKQLVLQPRTPLGLALGRLSSLVPRDLRQVVAQRRLRPVVRAAAQRLLDR